MVFVDGLITVRGKVYVAANSPSLPAILTAVHDMGHEGTEKTLHCYTMISLFLGQQQQSRNMFRPASFANAIRSNTFIQHVCCSHWRCQAQYGLI
jgi:hypothetical protein